MKITQTLIEIYNRKKEKDIYMPWRSAAYRDLFEKARIRIAPRRAFAMLELLKHAATIPGDICEMGVYKGGTAYLIADFISRNQFPGKLYLFDTFKGTMGLTEKDNIKLQDNYQDTNLDAVKQHLEAFKDFIIYMEGIIPSSFNDANIDQIAFANIHLNVYNPTKESLIFSYSRLSAGGIILIQDYGNKKYCAGVKEAVDEFCTTISESPLYIGEKQAMIIKNPK